MFLVRPSSAYASPCAKMYRSRPGRAAELLVRTGSRPEVKGERLANWIGTC